MPDELGAVLTLLPGWVPPAVPFAATLVATMSCWVAFVRIGSSAVRPAPPSSATRLLWLTIGGLVLMTAVLWLASDRYVLPFLPPALALVLGRSTRVSWRRAAIVLGLYAGFGLVGLRDRTQAQHAIWSAVDDLRQSGVPVSQIDAGYVVNGWLQYAHPEQANRDESGKVAVPGVNDAPLLPWVVAATHLPNTAIIREYRFGRTWRTPGSVFVLKRTSAIASAAMPSDSRSQTPK